MAINLSEKSEASLKRVMRDFGMEDRDRAIAHIVQDWLVGHGYLSTTLAGGKDKDPSRPDEIDPETVQYPSYFKDGGSI
jgi:hypothetical protein